MMIEISNTSVERLETESNQDAPIEYKRIMCPCDCGREIAPRIKREGGRVIVTPISPEDLAAFTVQFN